MESLISNEQNNENNLIEKEKMLTQMQVDKLLGERVLRERKKYEGILKENEDLKAELTKWQEEKTQVSQKSDAERNAQKEAQAELNAFEERYPDVDLLTLTEDKRFVKFIDGKPGKLADIYADFLDVVGETEKNAVKRVTDNLARSTESGQYKGASGGEDYGLTERQKMLAIKNNMSFKQYHSYLRRLG